MPTQQIKKGWKKVKLGDIVELMQGFCLNAKGKKYLSNRQNGIPLLKISDLINNTETLFVKKDIPKKFLVNEDEIIYSRTGQVGLAFIGKRGVIYNNCFKVIPKKGIYYVYLYHYLSSEKIINQAKSLAGGVAQPDLNHDSFKSIELTIPESFETQKKIASILSKYDDLIENNSRRINILEQTAQEIYKEWFVNYRFPGYEYVKLIDSGTDFGEIPEGWSIKSILDINYFRFINENIPKYEGNKIYYATADIDGINLIGKGEIFNYQNKPSRAQKQPITNSVWFARMQNTFKVLSFSKVNSSISDRIILSSGMVGFQSEEIILPFLYFTINSKDFHILKDMYCTGATQRALTNDGLSAIKIICPNKEIVEVYGRHALGIINEIFLLQMQNNNLKQTRDLLLPRLISGEVEVDSLDINF